MSKILFVITTLFLSTSLASSLGFRECLSMFPNQTVPKLNVEYNKTRELCFSEFAVLYSVENKIPVYSVQKLNYLRLMTKAKRTNNFHEEPLLSKSERSTLADYAHSGYDRGHNSEAGAMSSSLAMEESTSLANMFPQAPSNNRGIWSKIEADTRKYVKRSSHNVYVFTGGWSAGPNKKTIGKNKVLVPDFLYKLVYDEQTGKSWVFWVENKDEAKMSAPITYDEFVKKTGLKLLSK